MDCRDRISYLIAADRIGCAALAGRLWSCRGPPSDQRRARLPGAARVLLRCSGGAGKLREAQIEARIKAQIKAQVEAAPRKQA
jgi:hypothetical protein